MIPHILVTIGVVIANDLNQLRDTHGFFTKGEISAAERLVEALPKDETAATCLKILIRLPESNLKLHCIYELSRCVRPQYKVSLKTRSAAAMYLFCGGPRSSPLYTRLVNDILMDPEEGLVEGGGPKVWDVVVNLSSGTSEILQRRHILWSMGTQSTLRPLAISWVNRSSNNLARDRLILEDLVLECLGGHDSRVMRTPENFVRAAIRQPCVEVLVVAARIAASAQPSFLGTKVEPDRVIYSFQDKDPLSGKQPHVVLSPSFRQALIVALVPPLLDETLALTLRADLLRSLRVISPSVGAVLSDRFRQSNQHALLKEASGQPKPAMLPKNQNTP